MPFDRRAKSALIVACITLVVFGVGFKYAVSALNIYLQKERIDLRGTFATLSRTLGQWSAYGEDEQFDEALLAELGTHNTISRNYALNGKPRDGLLNVHIAYYTEMIDAVPHVPDRCFVAGGLEPVTLSDVFPLTVDKSAWREDAGPVNVATGQRYMLAEHRDAFTNRLDRVPMPVGDLNIRMTEFVRKDKPGIKWFGGYFFIANGRTTANPGDIRMLAFMPSERYAYYCKVQIVYAATDATRDQYLQLVSDFVTNFLPELMIRLPDWREVEARALSPAATSKPVAMRTHTATPALARNATPARSATTTPALNAPRARAAAPAPANAAFAAATLHAHVPSVPLD